MERDGGKFGKILFTSRDIDSSKLYEEVSVKSWLGNHQCKLPPNIVRSEFNGSVLTYKRLLFDRNDIIDLNLLVCNLISIYV